MSSSEVHVKIDSLVVMDEHGRTVYTADNADLGMTSELEEEEITLRAGDGSTVYTSSRSGVVTTSATITLDSTSSSASTIWTPAAPAAMPSPLPTTIETWQPPEILYVMHGEDGSTRLSASASHTRLRTFALDLNRCEHGIVRRLVCHRCDGGKSLGNPVSRGETPLSDTGYVILGYSVHGNPYVLSPDLEALEPGWTPFDENEETLKYARIWLVEE